MAEGAANGHGGNRSEDGRRSGRRGGRGGGVAGKDEREARITKGGSAKDRRLFVLPHRVILPDEAEELPTFNSNALNAVLHHIPGLAPWFLYSDDDIIFANGEQDLEAWWDVGPRGKAERDGRGRQRLYFQSAFVRANQPRKGNKWEDSMRYMSRLLDQLPRSTDHHPPPPPPPPPPPASVLQIARAGWRAVRSVVLTRAPRALPGRTYAKPQASRRPKPS